MAPTNTSGTADVPSLLAPSAPVQVPHVITNQSASASVAPSITIRPVSDSPPASYVSTAPNPPAANIPAVPNITRPCDTPGDQSRCVTATVEAIDNARATEGVGPMVLPAGFDSLTTGEQVFVMIDSERVDRGLSPIAGEVPELDATAASGAQDETDPVVSADTATGLDVLAWGSNWASSGSDVDAVYYWMYEDGPGGYNIDCTPDGQSGCWDHRDIILGFQNDLDQYGGSLSFGAAAFALTGLFGLQNLSVTTVTAWSEQPVPGYEYTWAEAVAEGAD